MSLKTNSSRLAQNAVLSLLGQMIPLVVAIVAIPTLIHKLGTVRFGL
jgi:hypothetical protein